MEFTLLLPMNPMGENLGSVSLIGSGPGGPLRRVKLFKKNIRIAKSEKYISQKGQR